MQNERRPALQIRERPQSGGQASDGDRWAQISRRHGWLVHRRRLFHLRYGFDGWDHQGDSWLDCELDIYMDLPGSSSLWVSAFQLALVLRAPLLIGAIAYCVCVFCSIFSNLLSDFPEELSITPRVSHFVPRLFFRFPRYYRKHRVD